MARQCDHVRAVATSKVRRGSDPAKTDLNSAGRRAGGLAVALICLPAILIAPAALGHGEWHVQIGEVLRQMQLDPNNPALYLRRGELYREHSDWQAAEEDYDRAAQLNPNLAAVDFCRGKLLADLGQTNDARALFDKYLLRCPEDGYAFVARARLLVGVGEIRSAIQDYTKGLERIGGPQPELFLERAQLQVGQDKVAAALSGLDEGIKKLGPMIALQLYAIDLEIGRKNYDGALARLNTILQQSLRKERWLARRAEILREAGRTAEAAKAFGDSLNAVKLLPPRLQQSPGVIELMKQVSGQLNQITNAPPTAASASGK